MDNLADELQGGAFILTRNNTAPHPDEQWNDLALAGGTPPPREKPGTQIRLTLSGTQFDVELTYERVFAVLRAIYLTGGKKEARNRMRAFQQKIRLTATGVWSPDDQVTYDLFLTAFRRIEGLAEARLDELEPLVQAAARRRLVEAAAEIRAEARHLRGPVASRTDALADVEIVLDGRTPADLYGLAQTPETEFLVDALRRCGRAAAELEGVRIQRRRVMAAAVAPIAGTSLAASSQPASADLRDEWETVTEILAQDPKVQSAQAQVEAAELALAAEVALGGSEAPVLYRIHRTLGAGAQAAEEAVIATAIVQALRETAAANRELTARLDADAGIVWGFPATVREALADLDVPEASIAWTAAEERLVDEQGPRLAAELGLVSGLSAGAASIAGAHPYVLLALGVTDVTLNVIDAAQEYAEYRRLKAGADAVLDPSRALGAEPGLLGTVFTIAMDAASVAGVPGDVRRVLKVAG